MYKIAIIGECMLELHETEKSLYKQTFSGDTFNCAVYFKRSLPGAHIEYITVLGDDKLSSEMIEFFHKEEIYTTYIDRLKHRFPGIYMIHTKNGERSFSYWRDNSAAKELFLTENFKQNIVQLLKYDLIYFSAITLAIMSKQGRKNLFSFIKLARKRGVKIAFDSNYRLKLYNNEEDAKKQHNEALKNCDIFLPSIDDEKNLFVNSSINDIIQRALKANCGEVVIKCGKENVIYFYNNEVGSVEVKKISKIIDSTSAGDAFNGAYLASRLIKLSIKESIQKANKLASKVVMHKGAIIQ
ncbi:MAG: sugar kinase [Epsilonproteobacteria bacterium]|nr:sugar kinase [Campylobacterota bacterium]